MDEGSSPSTSSSEGKRYSGKDVFEGSLQGAQTRPYIPPLRSDPDADQPLPAGLVEFRRLEGKTERKRKLRELWEKTNARTASNKKAKTQHGGEIDEGDLNGLTADRAKTLDDMYERELMVRCTDEEYSHIGWNEFKEYALAKEAELWNVFHDEFDKDGNGRLDAPELGLALRQAGIELSPSTLTDFITYLTSSPHSQAITFNEFRNFLLLLPRKVDPAEIYRYYEVKKFMGDDGRGGAARVTMEGDVSLSAEDKPPETVPGKSQATVVEDDLEEDEYVLDDQDDDEDYEPHGFLEGHTALKFLLAGGVAGAVSRTSTAPFDRIKIFLITRPPDLGGVKVASAPSVTGVRVLGNAVARIYAEGGLVSFWTGNGLSVAKIFPESAIKFFAYESAKRSFAKYWDKVDDPRDISGVSRFLSGGIGGISSQLSIYPIETLKTQMMSNTGDQKRTIVQAMRHLWHLGGLRAYYRGLTIGLVGVFPYSAIDMSTFEALKLAYLRSTLHGSPSDEPGVLALLAFGSISGSVGATSVYPLNLMRTRLQASGSSGHPTRYTGVGDVARKTWEREGWRGFYRGLFPTLAKVVPAVSISYVVYEHSKRSLGV